MSKPDKYGDSSDRDSREDFPELKDGAAKASGKEEKHSSPKEDKHSKPAADESDDLDSADEFLSDRAGMGKEIKIGLAVIAALLVVLAVVIVKRITASSEETASGDPEAAKHEEREQPPAKAMPIFASKGEKNAPSNRDWPAHSGRRRNRRPIRAPGPRPRSCPRSRARRRPIGSTETETGGKAGSWQSDRVLAGHDART